MQLCMHKCFCSSITMCVIVYALVKLTQLPIQTCTLLCWNSQRNLHLHTHTHTHKLYNIKPVLQTIGNSLSPDSIRPFTHTHQHTPSLSHFPCAATNSLMEKLKKTTKIFCGFNWVTNYRGLCCSPTCSLFIRAIFCSHLILCKIFLFCVHANILCS